MESKIGEDFKSIQPDFTNIAPNNTFEGAVYSGGGGLFASDRRANNVGDIITVTLEENITAANSGNETLLNLIAMNLIFLKHYLVHHL